MSGNTRIFLGSALTFIAMVASGCKKISNSSAGSGTRQANIQPARRSVLVPPVCPPFDSVLVSAPQAEHGHRVILKWKASRHADAKHSDAVGYCIYRGPNPNASPTELVNHLPFPETQCVDDSVENGKQYYYVVRAISARGVTSDLSKPPAPAKIPATPLAGFQTSERRIPLCREPLSPKSP